MRLMRWIGLLALMVSLAACGSGSSGSDNNSASAVQSDPANAGLVARVNGEGISQAEFDRALARYSNDATVADQSALAANILEGLIQQRVVVAAAAGMGITITDEEAAAEVDRLKAMSADPAKWQEYLDLNGFTEAEMQEAQKGALTVQNVQQVLFANLSGNVRQIHARHIVVASEAKALEVLTKLQNGGDFAALALEYSIDMTSRERGGDLGWFVPDELIDRRLADVAFNLNPGAIAGPIATHIGYHIIQAIEFEERTIEPERMQQLMGNIYESWLNDQVQKAKIERYL